LYNPGDGRRDEMVHKYKQRDRKLGCEAGVLAGPRGWDIPNCVNDGQGPSWLMNNL